jgi:hypothetical protein
MVWHKTLFSMISAGKVTRSFTGISGAFRHSRRLLAGIQARATAGQPCGWIPAKSLRE